MNYIEFKYWIKTSPTCDVTIFVEGHKMVNFFRFFAIFFSISVTLKAHISGTETDIDKR